MLVPGAFGALPAKLIADLGFQAIYTTGAGVTNMWFGMPDQGFMGLHEIADHTAHIRDAVDVPQLVDADTGFGNALNVRTPCAWPLGILRACQSSPHRASSVSTNPMAC